MNLFLLEPIAKVGGRRVGAILIAVCACSASACGPKSVIEDLGSLGGPSYAMDINDVGNVTGCSYLSANPHTGGLHAFRYVDGLGMIDVGALPTGNISCGQGINHGGFIVGGSFIDVGGDFQPHAFRANATLTLTDLGTLGGDYSNAWDINDQGFITGESDDTSLNVHAFLWSTSGMQDLGTLGGARSIGRSINGSRQVAGESQIGTGSIVRAFRFSEGAGMVSLGTLSGGTTSSAYGINAAGRIVGESNTGPVLEPADTKAILKPFTFKGISFFSTHAFLWTDGVGMKDLGHLGGNTSRANAISNNGMIVGSSTISGGAYHAFRWTEAGGMVDLNSLLPSNSGWVLVEAWGVNDRGQIVGNGLHNSAERAFRLNPPDLVNQTSAAPGDIQYLGSTARRSR